MAERSVDRENRLGKVRKFTAVDESTSAVLGIAQSPFTIVDHETLVRAELEAEGFGLLRREDGFYHVTVHGSIIAPFDWRVRSFELNDRGGEIGSPYPLTLGWIEHWLRGGMGRSPL